MGVGPESLEREVILRTAQGAEHARGKVVVYCPVPSVGIETADGRRLHWRADLTDLAPTPESDDVAARYDTAARAYHQAHRDATDASNRMARARSAMIELAPAVIRAGYQVTMPL